MVLRHSGAYIMEGRMGGLVPPVSNHAFSEYYYHYFKQSQPQHTGQHAQRQWAIRNQRQPQLIARRPHRLLLWSAAQEAVLHLHSRQRDSSIGQVLVNSAQLQGAVVGDPHCCSQPL